DAARDGNARGVARTPDDGETVLLVGIAGFVGVDPFVGDVSPVDQIFGVVGRRAVPNAGQIFVGHGRVDEGVVPREMALGPTTEDSREFADLEIEAAIVPRGEAQGVFVEARLLVAVARIEAAVEAGLGESVDVRAGLRVEEESEAWVEEVAVVGIEEAG